MASDEVAAEEERRKVEKPQLSLSVAVHLARKLFGMDVDEARVKQLESYDDVNFYLACRGGSSTSSRSTMGWSRTTWSF